MDFLGFFILLVISAGVSAVMHYGLNYYVAPGLGSFLSKVVIGWVGALFGTRMLGNWFGLNHGDIYYVPALLGCIAMLVFAVDFAKTCGSVLRTHS